MAVNKTESITYGNYIQKKWDLLGKEDNRLCKRLPVKQLQFLCIVNI